MKINKIKIKNFKSLRDIDIKLNNLTLITGVNSSGKSSFIQSLLLIIGDLKLAEGKRLIISIKVLIVQQKQT